MPNFVPTIYEQLETDVVARLQPLKTIKLEVCKFPESEIEFNLAYDRPRITVAFHSGVPGDPVDTNRADTEEIDHLQVIYQSKTLYGERGIYDLIRSVEALINGFKPVNFGRSMVGKFERHGRENGVWTYNQLYKTTSVKQQVLNDNIPDFRLPGQT